ncbi:MAG: organic hydroperoxide resistance protein [Pseudomonadota bacterium]
MKTLYEAHASATGGRDGHVTTNDGTLDLRLSLPKGLGGAGGPGANPEQLFAAGYAACFDNALIHVARQQKIKLEGTRVDATVGIGPNDRGGFALAVRLEVTVPGVPRDEAQALIAQAHAVCPYSNAVRGNVDVELILR